MGERRKQIAVIGGGVSGIVSAYLLSRKHEVVIYEAGDYLGGHTNTISLETEIDKGTPVDTGFIVLNNMNYPLFHKFLERLNVPVRLSDMSFGYYSELDSFQYAGTNLSGLFARRLNMVCPKFWSFLFEIRRFSHLANKYLESGSNEQITLNDFLEQNKFSRKLRDDFVVPMAGAIWSASKSDILAFPAKSLFHFFRNHGLLSLKNRPRWQTVVGGSQSYVKAFRDSFGGQIKLRSRVTNVKRGEDIEVHLDTGETFNHDCVVFATHADTTLSILSDASNDELRLLYPWSYQNNHTILHCDESALPSNKRTWASWNYLRVADGNEDLAVSVTYHMNRLQGLKCQRNYFVTLNPNKKIDKNKIIAEFNYTHPTFDLESVKTQDELETLNGQRSSYFCGSYFGHGFHEDAVRSAVSVAAHFRESL